jgi:hypothetical protein
VVKPAPAAPRVLTAEERERFAREKVAKEFAAATRPPTGLTAFKWNAGPRFPSAWSLLSALVRKYENKGIDLSTARNEQERVKSDLAQVSSDFRITLDFYKKTVAQGADAAERVSLLERMLKKYQKTGIDLTEVREELNRLNQP